MASAKSAAERALKYVGEAARIGLNNIRDNPGARTKPRTVLSKHNKAGKTMKELQNSARPPLGWVWGDWFCPWQRRFPKEELFNRDAAIRREYPPMSLLELQRLIDLGWLDPTKPIDLTSLCNTKQYKCDPQLRQFGVQLTDEGADIFAARINIEVQHASELAIAAIEKNGGVIVSAFYDPRSLEAVVDPHKHFTSGRPIPTRMTPPIDLINMYRDSRKRGYLAEPHEIRLARFELSQKYGYEMCDTEEPDELMKQRKKPNQCFYGLEPGWVVNLADKCVLQPLDDDLQEFYKKW